ncbi:unnamed protein product [[Candida] boidinii]|nr:unnamed protein product [[Candida] boidinii]
MLFGWRLRSSITNEEYNNLSLEIDNDMLTLLGQDIFWNPMLSNDSTMDFKKTDRRSSSIKTIAESTSSSNQSYHKLPSQDLSSPSSPSFQLDELNNDKNLPFSVIDSHFELIFLSLAFLKSKEFSLLELEQTEIKEFLNKMSSEKIDNFKNFLNNNQNKQQQQHNNNNNNKHHHSSSSNGTPHSIKIKAGLKATSSNNSSSSNLNEHDIDPFASATNSPSQESQSSFSTTPNINNNSSSDINNNTTNNNNNTQFQKSLLNRFNEMNIGPQQQQHHQRTGQPTLHPVVSPKSGKIFDKDLIIEYININGKDPITNEPLDSNELIELNQDTEIVTSRPLNTTSIPSLLSIFQNEFNSIVLENFELKKNLNDLRKELSISLYKYDSSIKVISKLMNERDELKKTLQDMAIGLSNDNIPEQQVADTEMGESNNTGGDDQDEGFIPKSQERKN